MKNLALTPKTLPVLSLLVIAAACGIHTSYRTPSKPLVGSPINSTVVPPGPKSTPAQVNGSQPMITDVAALQGNFAYSQTLCNTTNLTSTAGGIDPAGKVMIAMDQMTFMNRYASANGGYCVEKDVYKVTPNGNIFNIVETHYTYSCYDANNKFLPSPPSQDFDPEDEALVYQIQVWKGAQDGKLYLFYLSGENKCGENVQATDTFVTDPNPSSFDPATGPI